jgi:uncharacterized repeat protein (TIGR01451 family)
MAVTTKPTARFINIVLLFLSGLAISSGVHADTAGQHLPGQPGIEATTAELMLRQASAGPALPHPEHEVENPDRRDLGTDSQALPMAQSPPAQAATAAAPTTSSIHTTSLSFDGPTLADTGAFPPDSMGAVGPTQFVAFVNGRIRSFNKSGAADGILNIDPDVFFHSVKTPVGGSVVLDFTSDPQIRYDRFTARWFLTMIDVPCTNSGCTATAANRVLIAVSNAASNGSISNATSWKFFYFVGDSGGNFLDYPSLGIDVNALYIGGNMFSGSGSYVGTNGYVVRKSSVLGSGPIVVHAFANLASGGGSGPYSPRGVDNLDPNATKGYFIGVDNAVFSRLVLRRVSNPGTSSPSLSSNINVTVNTTTSPDPVEHAGNTGGSNGKLDSLDDRLFAATIRDGNLWTAHNFRVSTAGIASTSSSARNASRWYELQNLSSTPRIVQSGTVFDNTASRSSARQYFIPSITPTGQGHAVIGFTMAGVVGATPAYSGRLATDALGTMAGSPGSGVTSFGSTASNYNPPADPGSNGARRWGDYSFTSVDPIDEMTVWTIQEYNQASNSYAVRIGKLKAPPPATPTCSSSPIPFTGPTGDVVINATASAGSGFFDPGADLPSPARPFAHLLATVSNATVNSATYNSPTQVTLNITASTAGLRNVTLTNPDGQSVTANGCINVQAPGADLSISNSDGVANVSTGSSLTYTIISSNAGPLAVSGATMNDTFASDLSCTWTCSGTGGGSCTSSGSGNIHDVAVNLPLGATARHIAHCSVAAVSSNASLINTATIAAPAGTTDPSMANNSATDTDSLIRLADLSISNSDGSSSAIPGTPVAYQIVVENAGPNLAATMTTDTFPLPLSQCLWSCVASNGSCSANGVGDIADVGSLNAGGSLTYQASCMLKSTATGTVDNTATVAINSASQSDPVIANNNATDSDTVVPTGDLALSLGDNRDFVQVGDSVDYLITVTNASGPSTLKATVSDLLPAELIDGSWICVPSFGATCSNGSGNTLNDDATLPSGAQVSYLYSATVQGENGSGQISNAASVILPSGDSDPVPSNNNASISNTVVILRDGFDGTVPSTPLAGMTSVAGKLQGRLSIDPAVLEGLGIMPLTIVTARSADGLDLFAFDLARFGKDVFLRAVLRDKGGLSEHGPWQRLDAGAHLIDFAWQSASAFTRDGLLDLDGGTGGMAEIKVLPQ